MGVICRVFGSIWKVGMEGKPASVRMGRTNMEQPGPTSGCQLILVYGWGGPVVSIG